MTDLLRLDATALVLLGHDVALIPDTALANPTPCAGWTVADLLRHMNERHEAAIRTLLPPLDSPAEDPRDDFPLIATRWVTAVAAAGPTLHLPGRGPTSTDWLLGVHLVDMLVHRWDLAQATDTAMAVPAGLLDAALPLAQANTGGPLTGPGRAYGPRVDSGPTAPVLDQIVALLGRDPHWSANRT
ncbi:maleylpyruvate isomerase family mycothiol-dependent enzyme [Actinocatenispora rupis]|uniref:Mycothiol-dependent maleylpyruvate isomerase metal-binding domain-containing protein n=1 Tax=Actinocatenispora rupis TaxID=519421 RepID=A0A8J3NB08_9ACTN|nr:maleylpyruvate isomerase family mycothiol-dependent enzyme [Actinocatenispora rupis]GID10132.1 hypothetical protein Aru02nite_10210 [Actinocatenispora rupis]